MDGFDKTRYLGLWYEIARFDFAFEKGLDNTTAEYGLRPDGKISVVNRGYDAAKGKWREARGRARFRGDERRAELQVSFFGPFWADYNVIALDPEYRHALVAGSGRNYLWILSRDRVLPDAVRAEFLQIAVSMGFDTGALLWVRHDR